MKWFLVLGFAITVLYFKFRQRESWLGSIGVGIIVAGFLFAVARIIGELG